MIPDRLELAVLNKLAKQFGPMKSDDGVIVRMDGGDISQQDIDKAKHEAEMDVQVAAVKDEASRRIFAVTKDAITQINLAMWLTTAAPGPDLQVAKALVKWIEATLAAARKLKRNPNFREDRHWPKVPPGVRELIERL